MSEKPKSIYEVPELARHPARKFIKDLETARRVGGGHVPNEVFWTALARFHGVDEDKACGRQKVKTKEADPGIMTDEIRAGRSDEQIASDYFASVGRQDLSAFYKAVLPKEEPRTVDWDFWAKRSEELTPEDEAKMKEEIAAENRRALKMQLPNASDEQIDILLTGRNRV